MAEKTLREHLAEAGRARWAKQTPEQRKEYSARMNEAKNKKYPPKKKTSTGERTGGEGEEHSAPDSTGGI